MILALLAVCLLTVNGNPVDNCEWGASYWCQSSVIAAKCNKLQFCRQEVWKNNNAKPSKTSDISMQPQDSACDLCNLLTSFAKPYVDDNSTEDEVENALKTACGLLPNSTSSECTSLVNQYFGLIWTFFKSEVDSGEICKEIGICPSTVQVKQIKKVHYDASLLIAMTSTSQTCKMCDFLAKLVVVSTQSDKSEDEAKLLLLKSCEIVKPVETECVNLVNRYFDLLWEKITDKTQSSKAVCAEIFKTCPKPSKQKRDVSGIPGECFLCKHFESDFLNQEKVEGKLTALCQKVIKPSDVHFCVAIFTDIFNLLWKDFNMTDSKKVCEMIGLCSEDTNIVSSAMVLATVPTVRPIQQPQDSACDLCKLAATFIKPYVDSNSTEDEVENALKTACGSLPSSFSSECSNLVNEYFGLIWGLVKNDVDSGDICQQIGLCTSAVQVKQIKKQPQDTACDFCKLAVTFLAPYVDSNSTEVEVENALKSACGLLPNTISSECSDFVNQYFDLIWTLVKSEFDNGEICKQIGICPSTVQVKQINKLKQPQDEKCTLCQLIDSLLKGYLTDNKTETEAKAEIEKVCNLISSLKSECDALIKDNFDKIWQIIVNKEGDACKMIGLCNSTIVLPKQQTLKLKQPQDEECNLCKTVVLFLENYLKENKTETEAKIEIEKLCNILGPLKSECDTLIDGNFDKIWDAVVSETGDACTIIGLCNSTIVLPKQQTLILGKGIECILCDFIAKELFKFVNLSNIENTTVKALEEVCSVIPSKYKDECISFIDTYGDEIINAIINQATPATLCTMIGLCTVRRSQLTTTVGGGECDDCQDLLTFIKSLMTSNPSLFENALVSLCNDMPAAIKGECADIVKEYEPEVVSLIANAINPQALCKDVKLCAVAKKAKLDLPVLKSAPSVLVARDGYAGVECDGCIQLFEEMEVLIPKKKDTIVAAVSDVCSKFLPKEANDVCQIMCVNLGDEIVDLITSAINPRTDCKDLGVCKATKRSPSLANPLNSFNLL